MRPAWVTPVCARPGCSGLTTRLRPRYCSPECYAAATKLRQRGYRRKARRQLRRVGTTRNRSLEQQIEHNLARIRARQQFVVDPLAQRRAA